jgi:hypothetical protein
LPGPGQTGANFITPGAGGLVRGGGLTFGPDGNLYVSSQTTNEILRFDGTTGDPLPADGQSGATFVVADSNGLARPAGLVFGPGLADPTVRDLYVVSINTNTIEQFDGTTGNAVGSFIPPQSGGLSKPRGLVFGATDPSSLLYNPPAPPGGSAHGRRLHKITIPSAETIGFASLSAQPPGQGDLASFGSTVTGPTELRGQTTAGKDSLRRVDASGALGSPSHDREAVPLFSAIHGGRNGTGTSYGALGSSLVDLLALHLLEG